MDYSTLKLTHQLAVALSITGFLARGLGRFAGARWARRGAARWLPHVVDTVLLLSAAWMLWQMRSWPQQMPWLAAKLAGLLVYITLGVVAFRDGLPGGVRLAAWGLAVATVGWMVSVARSKHLFGFLAGLL